MFARHRLVIFTNPLRPVTFESLKLVTIHVRYRCPPPSPERTPPQNTSFTLTLASASCPSIVVQNSLSGYGIIFNHSFLITRVTIIHSNSLSTSSQLSFLLEKVADFPFTSVRARLSCYFAIMSLKLAGFFCHGKYRKDQLFVFCSFLHPREYL